MADPTTTTTGGPQTPTSVNVLPREELERRLADTARQVQEALEQRSLLEQRLKLTEQALYELEQRHSSLFDHNPDAVFSLDPQGRFTAANPAAGRVSGYATVELLGMSFRQICAPDQLEKTLENFQQCLRGHFERLETSIIHKDGQRVDLLVAGGPVVVDGALIAIHCAGKDITHRRQSEQAVRESEQRLRLALEAGRMGTWEWEISTGRVIWSAGLEAIHGLQPGTFAGTFDAFLADVHPADRPQLLERIGQTMAGGEDHLAEYRLLLADGAVCWVEGRGRLFRDSTGNPERMLGVCIDITHRKQVDQERNELLAREQVARAETERASRAKDEFLAVLSHELRTPLTPVLTYVQMMERDRSLSDESREMLAVIHRNVELESRLIDDLLDVTRLSRGKIELCLAPTALHEQIQHVLRICHSDIRSKQLKLVLELQAECDRVSADAARLQQVLWNLVKNAVKFTPNGGSIGIRTRGAEAGRLCVEVWDTGVGIEAGLLPYIFDAFEQGGGGVTRHHGGLGLGLTISKSLARMHGGTLQAFSEGKGRGCTFTLDLPLLPPAPQGPPPSPEPQETDENVRLTARILLVEDNADTARAMRKLLGQAGHLVRTADSVSAALRSAEAEEFDLLVCDIGLPDGTGLDLMRQLLTQRPVRGIAISGYGMEEDIRKSLEAGFLDHLTKPLSVQQLESSVSRILQAGRLEPGSMST